MSARKAVAKRTNRRGNLSIECPRLRGLWQAYTEAVLRAGQYYGGTSQEEEQNWYEEEYLALQALLSYLRDLGVDKRAVTLED